MSRDMTKLTKWLCVQRRLRSHWVDAQADLSLRWVHTHFVGFVMSWLIYAITTSQFGQQLIITLWLDNCTWERMFYPVTENPSYT